MAMQANTINANIIVNNNSLRELPFYGVNSAQFHSLVNSNLPSLPSKNHLERLTSIHDLDLFSLNTGAPDNNFAMEPFSRSVRCNYYSPHSFSILKDKIKNRPELGADYMEHFQPRG
jgi:hypothetical protein